MHVALQEGDEVWSGLGDYEVVDVEELCHALERRVPVGVVRVAPVLELVHGFARLPGHDAAVGVFAEDCRLSVAVEGGCGRVGGYRRGPDQLPTAVSGPVDPIVVSKSGR